MLILLIDLSDFLHQSLFLFCHFGDFAAKTSSRGLCLAIFIRLVFTYGVLGSGDFVKPILISFIFNAAGTASWFIWTKAINDITGISTIDFILLMFSVLVFWHIKCRTILYGLLLPLTFDFFVYWINASLELVVYRFVDTSVSSIVGVAAPLWKIFPLVMALSH